ncbi:MAG: Gfo/Idh/MocA family oxidoreductase, partial [Candidatus Tectomicrobia bacterium]|nr:Gfo/Idh/MocA family oxidoreductase [Candidatus Tectomicrobia bacterium]
PNARLTGVMDHGSGKGQLIAPDTDTRGAGDIDVFLARDDIDVILIATPSGTHMEIAVKAAEAGKHCMVEKPLDITLERIDRMIEAHEQAGTLLGGIFNTRYSKTAQLVKRAVEAGRFGRITFASALGPWWREQSYYDDSYWKGTWALDGGGALMNQGIHSIDLLQWLVGSPVQRLSGHIATLAHERIEVEDTGSASLEFADSALGTIACTTSMWPGHHRSITLAGTDGTAVLAEGNLLFWQFREETDADRTIRDTYLSLPGVGTAASDPTAGVTAAGHRAVFEDFLNALSRGKKPSVDGLEARKAVEIILAVYASAKKGGAPVTLPLG